MRVVLISPFLDIQSFGLRSLSACLKKEGNEVLSVFLPIKFTDKLDNETMQSLYDLSKDADIIGISLMTNHFTRVIELTNGLKNNGVKAPIIWGGVHPTLRPEECLEYADIVCIGEGEESIVELVNKISKGIDYYNTDNLYFKVSGEIIRNPVRPLITNLDKVPFPDYDYDNHYILANNNIQKMSLKIFKKQYGYTYVTMATRGCPYSCTYCSNYAFNILYQGQKIVRRRSIANIIDELIQIKNKFKHFESVKLDDDAFFTYSVEEIKEFSIRYKQEIGLPLKVTGAAPTTVNEEKLKYLVDAGLVLIRVGIQSGSEATKKLYGRNYSNQLVEKVSKIINKYSDQIPLPQYDVIVDNPWETDEDIIETINLLLRLPTPYKLNYFSLTHYPGTLLYDRAKSEAIIDNEKSDNYSKTFHECSNTYLNRIIYIISVCAVNNIKLNKKIIDKLLSKRITTTKISKLAYHALNIFIFPLIMKGYARLLIEALKDIRRGKYARIYNFINR